jgi:glycosyltransferase
MNVSIVTPVYNEPRIEHTLESILSQQGVSELEMIVVDGESTDETTEILAAYRDQIDILISEPDEGVYDAMNKGINKATNDVVGILNADDRYQHSNVLQNVTDTFEETEADLCYGDLVYVDGQDSIVRYWESGSYQPQRFYFGWMPPHPTVFVRRNTYNQYGKFDLEFDIAADYELLLRLLLKEEVDAAYLDEVLVRMALGGQSNQSLSSIFRANVEVARSWQKHNLKAGPLISIIKPLRKISQYYNRPELV